MWEMGRWLGRWEGRKVGRVEERQARPDYKTEDQNESKRITERDP